MKKSRHNHKKKQSQVYVRNDKKKLDLTHMDDYIDHFATYCVNFDEKVESNLNLRSRKRLLLCHLTRRKDFDNCGIGAKGEEIYALQWAHSMKTRPTENYVTLEGLKNAKLPDNYDTTIDYVDPLHVTSGIMLSIVGLVGMQLDVTNIICDHSNAPRIGKSDKEMMDGFNAYIYLDFQMQKMNKKGILVDVGKYMNTKKTFDHPLEKDKTRYLLACLRPHTDSKEDTQFIWAFTQESIKDKVDEKLLRSIELPHGLDLILESNAIYTMYGNAVATLYNVATLLKGELIIKEFKNSKGIYIDAYLDL